MTPEQILCRLEKLVGMAKFERKEARKQARWCLNPYYVGLYTGRDAGIAVMQTEIEKLIKAMGANQDGKR